MITLNSAVCVPDTILILVGKTKGVIVAAGGGGTIFTNEGSRGLMTIESTTTKPNPTSDLN